MAGGKREGAGRKKGSSNKATQEKRAAIAASGLTPLDYMLAVLRDENNDHATRMQAAIAAARFVHPTLGSIEHTGKDGGPIETKSEIELGRRVAFVLTKAMRDRLAAEPESDNGS